MKLIELTNASQNLELDKITINTDAISSIQKPKNGKCIIATNDGHKYLVKEDYDLIIEKVRLA